MMAATFRELAEDICAPQHLRVRFEQREEGASERWQRLAEMGLFGVLAPVGSGGMGLGDVDFVLLAEEAGRCALPEPLVEQAGVAVPTLRELSGEPRAAALLAAAAHGEARIAVVHPHNPYANIPPDTTHWLVCAESGIHIVAAAAVRATEQPSIDAGRRLFRLDAGPAESNRIAAAAPALACAARVLNRGAVYTAAQCLGLAERLLSLAVAYAKQRVQFGKPIGSYQAIKHLLANVQLKLEFARPVVYAAVARVADASAHSQTAVSHAKLAAGDAAELAARSAIQVHGAMGFSWEVDLHLYMKRVWALLGAWGDRSFHSRRVQSLVCGGAVPLGPDMTFEADV